MTNADLHMLSSASECASRHLSSDVAMAVEMCRKERALLLKAARDVIERSRYGRFTRRCSALMRLKGLAAECGEPAPAKEQK
jgi:hypothetical protein